MRSLVRAAGAGQGGGRTRRADSEGRRGGQHRLGEDAREGRRPRRLRRRRAEDPRQDRSRRTARGRHDPPLLPCRHRKLQPGDRHASTRTSACSRPTPSSPRTSPTCSTASPAARNGNGYRQILVAPGDLRPRLLELIRQEREAPDGRIVMKMNSLTDPRDHRRPLRRERGGDARSTSSCAASAACGRAWRGFPSGSACARSSAASSSTRASSASAATDEGRATTSARPT